jgi:hypothetical protein
VLLASNVADHTFIDDDQDVTLSLAYGENEFVLVIPDLSGETWEHALVDRQWSRSLDDAIAEAAGFMLFVHCKEINGGPTIVDVAVAEALLGDGVDEIDATAEWTSDDADVDAAGGDADDASRQDASYDDASSDEEEDTDADDETHCKQLTQVSLVELIQFFTARSTRPLRVSIAISAWDLEPKTLKPAEWLKKNAPLLDQYLQVNADEVEATVWGVSAQGANFADEKIREEYKDKDPIDRARVHAADGSKVGIAAPLRWVLRLDQ